MKMPRLLDIVMRFDSLGYDGFLVGSVQWLPLTCQFWRGEYEISNTLPGQLFGKPWIWADAVFVLRGDPQMRELLHRFGVDFTPACLFGNHMLGATLNE